MILVPGPVNVPRSVALAASTVVNHRSEEFREVVRELEGLMMKFFSADHVALLSGSGTLGVEAMVYSELKKGDKVITFPYGEFGRRLADSLKRRGCRVVTIDLPFGKRPTVDVVEAALDREKDAEAVALVHNETSSGVAIRDLGDVSKTIKGRGMKVLVDSVSGFGGHELRVKEWGIDAVASCSQKSLASVPGLAFVALSERREVAEDVPNYLDISNYMKFQDKGETPFTAAVGAFYATLKAAQLLAREGLENRWRRHEVCARMLRGGLGEMGLLPIGSHEDFSNTVVASYTKIPASKLTNALMKRGIEIAKGIGEYADKVVRVGVMGVVDWRALSGLTRELGEILNMEVKGDFKDCVLPPFLEEEVNW